MNAIMFQFDLVSPDKVLVSEPVWQVTIPGQEGYFGVRSGHMSLVAAVKPGVVEILRTENAAPEKIFIAGGFADVTAANCTILAEQAINVGDLDIPAIEADLASLESRYIAANDIVEKSAIDKQKQIAESKLKAAQSRNL